MITALIFFVLGILLNAFFAGYETGFVASNRIRVRHLAETDGNPHAARLLHYIVHPERMITVVLVGTNMALVMGTIALTREMENIASTPEIGALWSTLIATPLFLVFGEVLPKSAFRLHPTRLSLALLPVIRFFELLLFPIVVPISWLSARLVAMVEGEKKAMESVMSTVHDMRVLFDESAHRGTIEEDEKAMIHSVIDLQSILTKEVMVPRINIVALPETASRSELIAKLIESGYTRLPVYRESIDAIIGVVNAFDVLRAKEKFDTLDGLIQDVLHVPDTMKLDDLLDAMREQSCSIAVVTDEYGGTDGIITQEDVLEEIFGEFHDEYDKDETSIRKVSPGAFVVDAHMELEEAAEAMGVVLIDEEVETVGGWVMHLVGRIPATGEVIRHGVYKITVLEGRANSLSRLRIEIKSRPKIDDKLENGGNTA